MAEMKLFEATLGIEVPWVVRDVAFDAKALTLALAVDFKRACRCPLSRGWRARPQTSKSPSASST